MTKRFYPELLRCYIIMVQFAIHLMLDIRNVKTRSRIFGANWAIESFFVLIG